ncbi:MAG: thymidine phosphorylase [Opitutales bacterium]|nr:thymidine phosphorylase [Opitutales bacterium]
MSLSVIISKVRDKVCLSKDEIDEFSAGLASGLVSDAQAAAFAMAVCLNGLSQEERVFLTLAMRDTGNVQKWKVAGPVIDKHSTGGIGDNVSLVLAPLLAACGAYVPMVSGRGLGHTGGTLDKLESIPGYRTEVGSEEFERIIAEVGCAIVGAGEGIAPADKRLYAIRDLTGTVESLDLITSSILSKKLAAGLDSLILDVKVGSGSFMTGMAEARELAQSLVSVANGAGCKTTALLTDMNESLADAAGNALEVKSALKLLKNEKGQDRLLDVVLSLGANLLVTSGLASDIASGREALRQSLANGQAVEVWAGMIHAQGGPHDFIDRAPHYLGEAGEVADFLAPIAGYVSKVDGRILGQTIIELGGGRKKAGEVLNFSVGLDQFAGIGQKVGKGDLLLRIHASSRQGIDRAKTLLSQAFEFSPDPVKLHDLIVETIV